MKPIKTIKNGDEVRRFFTEKVGRSEKIVMGGKTLWMTINHVDDFKEINHKFKPKTNIKEKRCSNCGETKSVKYFFTDNHSRDGFSAWCNLCGRNYGKEYTKKQKEEKEKRLKNLNYKKTFETLSEMGLVKEGQDYDTWYIEVQKSLLENDDDGTKTLEDLLNKISDSEDYTEE